jgi:hypothetical protein
MSEENDNTSSGCFNTLGYIFILCIVVIPGVIGLSSMFLENNPEIAENVQDFESGIKLNSVAGDYKIYEDGVYSTNKISCNVQGRGISFSRKVIDEDHEDLMEAFSSKSFDLISEDPLVFEGAVLEKRESNSESRRLKTRLTFDGETRLTISIWDDDSGKWKNITSKLYFDKD